MSGVVVHRPGAPALVGRTGELHTLLDAVNHPPAVVLVEGEAGIGKTRLVQEALAHPSVAHRTVLAGTCHPIREPFPYGPMLEVLRQLEQYSIPTNLNPVCGVLRPYLPELSEHLPPAPEVRLDHRTERHQLFRAVRELLSAAGPTVLVIEDLHWADDGSRDLIRFLIDDPPAELALVMTYRREELPATDLPLGRAYRHTPGTTSVLIPLFPLDVSAVRSMTATILGRTDVSSELADELRTRTAGIPFVLEEVLRALPGTSTRGATGARLQATVSRDALDRIEVPVLLREMMADQMAALTAEATQAVRAAAVLRLPSGETQIADVAAVQEDAIGPSIREALAAGALHEIEEGRYGFRHSLAQQAVYDSIPGPDRRELHRRAGQALDTARPRPLVQLAYHARRAEQIDKWVEHGEAAADSATELGDIASAVEILEGMLADSAIPRADESRLAINLSRVAVVGLAHHRAVRILRRVLRDNHLPEPVRGEIRMNLGLLLVNQGGEFQQGRVDIEIAIEELRDQPALAARGMAALAMPSWPGISASVNQEWIDRALRALDGDSAPAQRMAVRGNQVALAMNMGDPDAWRQAEELLDRDHPSTELLQVARTYGNLADAAAWLGRYEASQRFRADANRFAADGGAPYFKTITDGTGLRLDWHAGTWQGLADRAREVLLTVHGVGGTAADAHLVLALLAVAVGEADDAVDHLASAGTSTPDEAPVTVAAVASATLIRILLSRGDVTEACAEAERALTRIREKGIWVWASDLVPRAVSAMVRDGRIEQAETLLTEFADGIAGRDAPRARAAQHGCIGIVAQARNRSIEAAEAFTRAQDGYVALPEPYLALRAAESAARCRMSAGDADAARELTGTAEGFAELGATKDAARCRRVLREAGIAIPSARGRRGYGDQLSPREREVVRLVANGHTNRQIAEVLFLSPRTVEQHVSKAMRKLGVSSRAEVASISLTD